MTPGKILRAIELLSKGYPYAWGITGFTIVAMGIMQVIYRQDWFVTSGDRVRLAVGFAVSLVLILAVVFAVVLKHNRLAIAVPNSTDITW